MPQQEPEIVLNLTEAKRVLAWFKKACGPRRGNEIPTDDRLVKEWLETQIKEQSAPAK